MALSKAELPGTPQHFLECGIEDCEGNCEFYCNLCHTRLCKQCRDEHLRSPETKSHEVVLYQQRKQQLPTEKCKIHPTKDIDLLCEECQIPLCSKCTATSEHRGHTFTDLESIYTEKFSHCQGEIAKIHEYFLPTSKDLQREINGDTKEIKKIMDNIRTSMKAEAESLKCMVDSVTSENMEEVNKIEESLLEKLNNQDTTIEKYITYLNDLDKKFHVYLSSLKPTKLLTAEEMQIQPIPETTKPLMPVFTAGRYSKDYVAKFMGKITFPNTKEEMRKVQPLKSKIPASYLKPTRYQIMKESQPTSSVKQILSLSSSVTKVRELKVPGVETVWHMSLDKSGRLWVSHIEGNLVQTDLQGNQLQKIKTSDGFGYHTMTQDGDLIFIDYKKKVINRITQDNNITEFIKTGDWAPISIHSSHINGDLLVGMVNSEEGKVTRYNKTGKELQNIQRDNKGQGLYSKPIYITENINGDICTSEYDKAVVVVNKSGQHRFSYKGQGSVFRPYGICTDVLGHILVCDSDNVHLLDQDGQFLSLLLTSPQVSNPISVCVDDENNLYVGQSRNNTVIVIKYLQSMNTE
ncbi:uncharacterized protein LOC133190532 [Saccostrea echinata]|uniref:uncharacterized protein LOC133190532 n=1 Tax=Saccostrea echinata TaxID=191078 RepID=UPI002A7F6111|nr:uncharacterized protein LOC133190532 [Saccostrea echinata]XP_061182194.1 uncharacterized protein LOC133190532 [Saccostrea echinata]